jgi:hypothetical protein
MRIWIFFTNGIWQGLRQFQEHLNLKFELEFEFVIGCYSDTRGVTAHPPLKNSHHNILKGEGL